MGVSTAPSVYSGGTVTVPNTYAGPTSGQGIVPGLAAPFKRPGAMGLETAAIVGITSAVSAGASAGAGIYAANKQGAAARDAASASERANAEAVALERDREMARRREWDQTQAWNEKQWNVAYDTDAARWISDKQERDRALAIQMGAYTARQQALAPYRAVSKAAVDRLASLADLAPQAHTTPAYIPPEGWSNLAPPPAAETEAATMARLAQIKAQEGRA